MCELKLTNNPCKYCNGEIDEIRKIADELKSIAQEKLEGIKDVIEDTRSSDEKIGNIITKAVCDMGTIGFCKGADVGALIYQNEADTSIDHYRKKLSKTEILMNMFRGRCYAAESRLNGWIPCSVRRPSEDDSGKSYLVTNGYEMLVCDWCGDYWENDPFCGDRNCMDITHWMELPGLPKKEDK